MGPPCIWKAIIPKRTRYISFFLQEGIKIIFYIQLLPLCIQAAPVNYKFM